MICPKAICSVTVPSDVASQVVLAVQPGDKHEPVLRELACVVCAALLSALAADFSRADDVPPTVGALRELRGVARQSLVNGSRSLEARALKAAWVETKVSNDTRGEKAANPAVKTRIRLRRMPGRPLSDVLSMLASLQSSYFECIMNALLSESRTPH